MSGADVFSYAVAVYLGFLAVGLAVSSSGRGKPLPWEFFVVSGLSAFCVLLGLV